MCITYVYIPAAIHRCIFCLRPSRELKKSNAALGQKRLCIHELGDTIDGSRQRDGESGSMERGRTLGWNGGRGIN